MIETASTFSDDEHTRSLVLLTDGVADDSAISVEEVVANADANDYSVYPVGLGEDLDHDDLSRVASRTGGVFAPVDEAAALTTAFEGLATAARGSIEITLGIELGDADTKLGGRTYILEGEVVYEPTGLKLSFDGQRVYIPEY